MRKLSKPSRTGDDGRRLAPDPDDGIFFRRATIGNFEYWGAEFAA